MGQREEVDIDSSVDWLMMKAVQEQVKIAYDESDIGYPMQLSRYSYAKASDRFLTPKALRQLAQG